MKFYPLFFLTIFVGCSQLQHSNRTPSSITENETCGENMDDEVNERIRDCDKYSPTLAGFLLVTRTKKSEDVKEIWYEKPGLMSRPALLWTRGLGKMNSTNAFKACNSYGYHKKNGIFADWGRPKEKDFLRIAKTKFGSNTILNGKMASTKFWTGDEVSRYSTTGKTFSLANGIEDTDLSEEHEVICIGGFVEGTGDS